MIHPSDINPMLMMDPGLNAIIAKANEHMETTSKDLMSLRREVSQTMALYHTVLNKQLDEATVVTMKKGKPVYPEKWYLGNIIINYLPEHHAWKITITNGGSARKNAKTQLEIKDTLYLRRTNGHYWADSSFYTEVRTP